MKNQKNTQKEDFLTDWTFNFHSTDGPFVWILPSTGRDLGAAARATKEAAVVFARAMILDADAPFHWIEFDIFIRVYRVFTLKEE